MATPSNRDVALPIAPHWVEDSHNPPGTTRFIPRYAPYRYPPPLTAEEYEAIIEIYQEKFDGVELDIEEAVNEVNDAVAAKIEALEDEVYGLKQQLAECLQLRSFADQLASWRSEL